LGPILGKGGALGEWDDQAFQKASLLYFSTFKAFILVEEI